MSDIRIEVFNGDYSNDDYMKGYWVILHKKNVSAVMALPVTRICQS